MGPSCRLFLFFITCPPVFLCQHIPICCLFFLICSCNMIRFRDNKVGLRQTRRHLPSFLPSLAIQQSNIYGQSGQFVWTSSNSRSGFFEISFGERDYRKSPNCSPARIVSMSVAIAVFLTPQGGKKIWQDRPYCKRVVLLLEGWDISLSRREEERDLLEFGDVRRWQFLWTIHSIFVKGIWYKLCPQGQNSVDYDSN